MKGDRGLGELGRRQRGPNLPDRTRDQESFRQNIPRPSGSAETFARHHAELYADEEGLVDGEHIGNPHFPRGSERARMHGEYQRSNQHRDRTREAYNNEFNPATAEYQTLGPERIEYYDHTSGGLLPRHHARLLPLAREREGPNYHNATNRERLLTRGYEYHSLEDQQIHWRSADGAYSEHGQVRTDHAHHRRYRSDLRDNGAVDCYGNSPVHDTQPHSRSRRHGLPPSDRYCDRLHTPPEEDDRWDGEGYGHS